MAPLVPGVAISAYVTWSLLAPVSLSRSVADWAGMMALACAIALIYAFPTALILGLPAYTLLSGRMRPRPLAVMLVGALVAAAPLVLAGAFVGLTELLERGAAPLQLGAALSLELAANVVIVFGLGGLGGGVFWLCVFRV